jgi:hypothetical protein
VRGDPHSLQHRRYAPGARHAAARFCHGSSCTLYASNVPGLVARSQSLQDFLRRDGRVVARVGACVRVLQRAALDARAVRPRCCHAHSEPPQRGHTHARARRTRAHTSHARGRRLRTAAEGAAARELWSERMYLKLKPVLPAFFLRSAPAGARSDLACRGDPHVRAQVLPEAVRQGDSRGARRRTVRAALEQATPRRTLPRPPRLAKHNIALSALRARSRNP